MGFALIAFGVGFVSGLRTLTAFTIASWAARLGRLSLQGSWLAFVGYAATPWIMSLAALGELVNDKLPKTPSRKTPPQFAARILFRLRHWSGNRGCKRNDGIRAASRSARRSCRHVIRSMGPRASREVDRRKGSSHRIDGGRDRHWALTAAVFRVPCLRFNVRFTRHKKRKK